MVKTVSDLKDILSRQNEIYSQICRLEEKKENAIINKNGKELKELSISQEKLLSNVDKLEDRRMGCIRKHIKENNINGSDSLTLREFVDSMSDDSARFLLSLGVELREKLFRLKEKQASNSRLMDDNMEYFNILISGLKDSSIVRSGYGIKGKEEGIITNPVLFNQQV